MEWDTSSANGAKLAAKIDDLKHDELDRFFRERLRKRELHQVVAGLNETALAKDSPYSDRARKALKRLGFTD